MMDPVLDKEAVSPTVTDNDKVQDANDRVFPHIFVTVGTTFYDDLITWAQTKETLNYFKKWKVKCVRLQIGSSKLHKEGNRIIENIPFEFYSYKPSLTSDYEWADLVISHAGAGTVLDVLDLEKTLFLIPNESLMDNHQVELGDFIHKESYGYSSSLIKSHSMMDSIKRSGLKKFPSRNIEGFLAAVEETMKFDPLGLAKVKMQ